MQLRTIYRDGIALGLNGFDVGLGRTPPSGPRLVGGDELRIGEQIMGSSGANGQGKLIMQSDGNLVLYNARNNFPLWWTLEATGPGATVARMQTDGNFVVYGGQQVWSTGTAGNPGAYLEVQNDGNLVVYAKDRRPLWASNTANWTRTEKHTMSPLEIIAKPLEEGVKAATGQTVHITSVSVSPKEFAQAVQAALSFVPVIGTGINAAIAAGAALAEGENITDAFVDGAKAAIPGGPLVTKGFDVAFGAIKAAAHGQPVDEVVLAGLREGLPSDAAKKAFDIGAALAHGQNVQSALVSAGASLAAGELNKIALPPILSDAARALPPETTRVASAIVNRPELVNLAASEIAKRLATNEATVAAASKAVTDAKNSAAMAQIAKMSPEDQKRMMAYAALAKLTPEQRDQLAKYVAAKTPKAPPVLHAVQKAPPKLTAAKPVVVSSPAPAVPPTVSAKAGHYPPYPKMHV